MFGADDAGVTLVPISNTEVKPGSAEDTQSAMTGENMWVPNFFVTNYTCFLNFNMYFLFNVAASSELFSCT